jgi:Holliday junction resolvasome RuvABC endonuclease subunit
LCLVNSRTWTKQMTTLGKRKCQTSIIQIDQDQKKRKKKKKKKKVPLPKVTTTMVKNRIDSLKTTVFGIDMSLLNPGLAEINPTTRTVTLYYFRNRKCEKNGSCVVSDERSCFAEWTMECICLENMTVLEQSRFGSLPQCNRYMEKVTKILALIGNNFEKDKHVGIEHYSFNSRMSGPFITLIELGGVLRSGLSTQFHNVTEIAPTAVKKMFSGNGRATKDIMYEAYKNDYYLPDIGKLIGLGGKTYVHTPHPVEDMVDALAVALTVLFVPRAMA